MDSDDLSRMYAQITRGVPKEESRFVTDDETSALWDQIASEVDQIRKDHPKAQFAVPNEVPGAEAPDQPLPGSDAPEDNTETPDEPPADGEPDAAAPESPEEDA